MQNISKQENWELQVFAVFKFLKELVNNYFNQDYPIQITDLNELDKKIFSELVQLLHVSTDQHKLLSGIQELICEIHLDENKKLDDAIIIEQNRKIIYAF